MAFCAAVFVQRSVGRCDIFPPDDVERLASGPLAAREIAVICWLLHFVRRAAESAWLHRYSQPSVPIFDTVTEFLYYWGFAVWIAHSVVCSEDAQRGSSASALSARQLAGGLGWILAEAGNCYVHVQLAQLRPSGDAARSLPEGRCFELVSFPHYLCEICSWIAWNVLVGLPSSALDPALWTTQPTAALSAGSGVLFAGVGAAIMAGWADEKHDKMRKHFNGKEGKPLFPVRRKRILPYVF